MRISDWSSDVCSSDLAGEARRGLLVLRRKPRRQDLQRVATAMSLDDRTRTWQLVMTGDDLRHVTLETQADMARLLDLDPSISHLTLEIGDDRVHVARDWPSDHYEEADRLNDRIEIGRAPCRERVCPYV